MTPQENIQSAQAGYAAFARNDMAGVLAVLDENVIWTTPEIPAISDSGVKKGHNGVLEFFASIGKTWEFEAFEPREFIASGDQVAVCGHYRVRSRGTGRVASSDWVMVWKFRDGKCTHFQECTDTRVLADALMARAGA